MYGKFDIFQPYYKKLVHDFDCPSKKLGPPQYRGRCHILSFGPHSFVLFRLNRIRRAFPRVGNLTCASLGVIHLICYRRQSELYQQDHFSSKIQLVKVLNNNNTKYFILKL